MKPHPSSAQKTRQRDIGRELGETLRIGWPIIVTLLAIAAIAFVMSLYVLPRTPVPNSMLEAFFLSLSASLLVAILIYMFLERGIRSLNSVEVVRRFPFDDYIERVTQGKHTIRIVGIWSRLVTDDAVAKKFEAAIRNAILHGAHVQVLLSHPNSEGAKQRAIELGGLVDVLELGSV